MFLRMKINAAKEEIVRLQQELNEAINGKNSDKPITEQSDDNDSDNDSTVTQQPARGMRVVSPYKNVTDVV